MGKINTEHNLDDVFKKIVEEYSEVEGIKYRYVWFSGADTEYNTYDITIENTETNIFKTIELKSEQNENKEVVLVGFKNKHKIKI